MEADPNIQDGLRRKTLHDLIFMHADYITIR